MLTKVLILLTMLNPAAVAAAAAAAARHPVPGGPAPSSAPPPTFKLNIVESIERIKEEFNFLQAQYHNLKLECEKLVQEKTEMQRHYVMYYEMSYGLNVEMHKQMEIAKRLSAIIAQLLPFLSQEHQQQVVTAIERAKQVTMQELNSIIGQQQRPDLSRLMQLQAAGGAPGLGAGLPPGFPASSLHPGLTGGIPTSSAASLLAGLPPGIPVSSAAAFAAAAQQMGARLPVPPGLPGPPSTHDLYRKEEEHKASAALGPMSDERNRTSLSPSRERGKSPADRRSPLPEAKKQKKEEERPPVVNGLSRTPPKENGIDLGLNHKKDLNQGGHSPHSGTSSTSSTPAPKKVDETNGKRTPTPKHASPPSSVEGSNGNLKPGLPGPPYGIGFPTPPGIPPLPTPANGPSPGSPSSFPPRPTFDAHPAVRAPPQIGLPPGGKPYSLLFPC